MGSKSQSRTASTNTTTNINDELFLNNIDNRLVEGDGFIEGNQTFNLVDSSLSGGLTIESTDFGVVDGGFGLASEAIELTGNINDRNTAFLSETFSTQLGFVSDVLDSQAELSERSSQALKGAFSENNSTFDVGKLAPLGIGAVVLIAALNKFGK